MKSKKLVVNKLLSSEGFGYNAKPDNVKIFARPVSHREGVSYDRLIEYNSRGQARVNKRIANPPLVFPTNPSETMMMSNEFKVAKNIFREEANKQIKDAAKMNLKVILRVG